MHDARSVAEWSPTPQGDGWILVGIWDTEDGAQACFVKPQSQEPSL